MDIYSKGVRSQMEIGSVSSGEGQISIRNHLNPQKEKTTLKKQACYKGKIKIHGIENESNSEPTRLHQSLQKVGWKDLDH